MILLLLFKHLHNNQLIDIARYYFRECVLPLICNGASTFLVNTFTNIHDFGPLKGACRKLLELMDLFPDERDSAKKALSGEVLKTIKQKESYPDQLCWILENQRELLIMFPALLSIFVEKKSALEKLAREKPVFSWSMPDAKLSKYPLVEEFLRSEQTEMRYQFNSENDLRMFLNKYQDNFGYSSIENGFSANITALPNRMARIEKTRKLFESKMEVFLSAPGKIQHINDFLLSFEPSKK